MTKFVKLSMCVGLTVVAALPFLVAQPAGAQFVGQPVGTPDLVTGAITNADTAQAGRINRNNVTSTCNGKTATLQNSTPVRAEATTLTNNTGQSACVRVDWDFTGCGANSTMVVAYSSYNSASPAANVIGAPGASSTGTGSFSFTVASGASFTLVVHEITANTGCANYRLDVSYFANVRQNGFTRTTDKRADTVLFRPTTGVWYLRDTASTATSQFSFGLNGDIPVTGDYNADGITEAALFRPSNNTWYVRNSLSGASGYVATVFGSAGDIPVPNDYDGDGRTDIAVFRPASGVWYVLGSDVGFFTQQWGKAGDVPVPGDYDGDGFGDFAVHRPSDHRWYIKQSNFDASINVITQFGLSGDKAAAADYDGDGRDDIAIFRPSQGRWYIQNSSNGSVTVLNFGTTGDIPVMADYDGDLKADMAVFRPSTGTTWIRSSQTGAVSTVVFGTNGDIPVTQAQQYSANL